MRGMVALLWVVLAQVSVEPCAVSMLPDATQQPPGTLVSSKKRALLSLSAGYEARCAGDRLLVWWTGADLPFTLRFDAPSDRLELMPFEPDVTGDAAHLALKRFRKAAIAFGATRNALGKGVFFSGGTEQEALARLQREFDAARLAARPFHLEHPQRLGVVPRKQSLEDVWWSGATPCVRQGSGGAKVRCFDVGTGTWSKAVPAAQRPRDEGPAKYAFDEGAVVLSAELATSRLERSPRVSWTLAELGFDPAVLSSPLLDARRARARELEEARSQLDCSGRNGRLWMATHTDADEQECTRLELEAMNQPPIVPTSVWFDVPGDAAVLVFEFDDAWELFVVSAR